MEIKTKDASSSANHRYYYQVFLSFRGKDTRKTFTDHLYTALHQAGLRTFRDDDDIERGKKLELELQKAIQESRISIIVFSKNYAYSKWCLDEVLMIMKWSKTGENEVLPIFYDVDPSDVRKQRGSIGDAFSLYEKELIDGETDVKIRNKWIEKLKCWRVALEEVANLKGMVLQNEADGHEAKFIQEIVHMVRSKINPKVLDVGHHIVGMEFRVRSIDLWVRNNSSSENIFVISGMGGIGKTTIAKHVYNMNYQQFEGSSFLASVKEESECSHGLVKLQMQLLSSILKGTNEEIRNIHEGINKIKEAICYKRILVVIDDVDDMKQLDALLGTREFHPGSKIIITTRDKSLLKAHEAHKLHRVPVLSEYESIELFCWHAFGKEKSAEDYKELSTRAVSRCAGLPLAHKILGSSLAGKSTKVWASMLDKLEAMPDIQIVNVLKISFLSLKDNHDRNLFLHIACFFVGHNKDEIIAILDECNFYTECGIENLIDRCLLSIDSKNNLIMHQLVQEMGWEIVDEETERDPNKRRRVWRPKDSFTVLKEKKGTEAIEGLLFDMKIYKNVDRKVKMGKKSIADEYYDIFLPPNHGTSFSRQFFSFLSSEPSIEEVFNYDAFSGMHNLRLLKLNYTKLTGSPKNFPECLRWLCWHGFASKSIPFDLSLTNLVCLDMSFSKLEHFGIENKVLLSLKILNLSQSEQLIKTPNFRGLPNLEKLILKGCVRLLEVCDTIGSLKSLALLNLENCKSLSMFPNIGMLTSLQSLVLDGCSDSIFESLKLAYANGATGIPSTSRDKYKQRYMFFQALVPKPELKYPRRSAFVPHCLVSLSLQHCNLSDGKFPLGSSPLPMLEKLDLGNNHFINMPDSIGNLSRLSYLRLSGCKELLSVSSLPTTVSVLNVSDCVSLQRIAYHSTPLEEPFYSMDACPNLIEIQDLFKLEPMDKVSTETLDTLGLRGVKLIKKLVLRYTNLIGGSLDIGKSTRQGLYEFGIFSTFLRLEEIPKGYIHRSNNGSSSVSLVVPSHPSLRFPSLNVYSLYKFSDYYREENELYLFIKINNKTKGLSWIYAPVVVGVPEDSTEELAWVSHWKLGSQLECGDQVDISIIPSDCFHIQEVHINVIWGEKPVEMNGTHNLQDTVAKGVIGGDLSSYRLMSKETFVLATQFSYPHSFSGGLDQKLFGDHVEDEDVEKWIFGYRSVSRITKMKDLLNYAELQMGLSVQA